jgi:transposase-like protein
MFHGSCRKISRVKVDGRSWYRWTLERLGLEYEHQRFGLRNRVERFFRYLKERMMVFHHKLSARNHIQGVKNLNLFLNLYTLYHQTIKMEGG